MKNGTSTGPNKPQGTSATVLAKVVAILFWIGAWQIASMAVNSEFVLAGPLDAAAALVRLFPSGEFWRSVGFSLIRIAGGCAIAYLLAVPLALIAAALPAIRTLLQPAMSAIKGTPIACTVVALLIWFGSRNISAIAVGLAVIPGVYFGVLQGLDRADPRMRDLFRTFNAPAPVRLLARTWPAILPYLRAASQSVLGMSWKAGIAAELIGVPTDSVGERIYQAKLLLETADLFAWTIAVVALAWLFERLALRALDATWPASAKLALRFRRHEPEGAPVIKPSIANKAPILTASNLVCGHNGIALSDPFGFHLRAGDIVCIEGPSGAGKTTLLNTLAGSIDPMSGSIDRGHGDTAIAQVYQDIRLVEELSAIDNVMLIASAGLSSAEARKRLEELLPSDAIDVPVGALSGGQRRRVELVRAFAASSHLVLLDEPFTGLDAQARELAQTHILAHMEDRAVLISAHDATSLDLPLDAIISVGTACHAGSQTARP